MKKEGYCDACDRVKSKCVCKCDKCKKLKSECTCPKQEPKEQTMADASGSFEAPVFGKTIMKKDIHKLHNFKPTKNEVKEQMDAGVSAGAMYDGPIGTSGPSSPMDHKKKKRKDPLALDEKGDNSSRTASITASSTDDMISTKKGFPRFGGPKAKFVEIDKRCKTFPYCNQGADNQIKFISEIHGMKEAVELASKKYGLSVKRVEEMILKEAAQISEGVPNNIDFTPATKWGRGDEPKYIYHLITTEPLDIKIKSESEFEKLKLILHANDVKFQEEKIPIEGKSDIEVSPSDDDFYAKDGEFDDDDDIFANMKE